MSEEDIDLSGHRDTDYIEIYHKYHKCENCGKNCDPNHISELNINYTRKHFCGFKCIVHYYIKELKEEGKL